MTPARIEAIKQECRAKMQERMEEKIRFYAGRTSSELERIAADYASDADSEADSDADPLELIASEYASGDESDSVTRKRRNDTCYGVRVKRAKYWSDSEDEDYEGDDYEDDEHDYDYDYEEEYGEETEENGYDPEADAERMTFVNETRALIKAFESAHGLAPLDRIQAKAERAIEVMAKVREYRSSHVTPAEDLKLHRFFEVVDRKKAELLGTQIPEAREEASTVRVLRSNAEKHRRACELLDRLEAEVSL